MEIPSAKFGALEYTPALSNGAGMIKKLEDVREMALSAAGAIVVGSITLKDRPGNTGNTFWVGQTGSINSLGIPNPGKEYYRQNIHLMVGVAHAHGKKLIVNVAGFQPNEFGELALLAFDCGADAVELNFGCPNIWDDGTQKGIISFYPDVLGESLEAVRRAVGVGSNIIAKVSPFSNPIQLKEIGGVIVSSGIVSAITAINTFPNAYGEYENGRPVIDPGGGLGGFAGAGLKHIALGQVKQWRALLPPEIAIIGVGGISRGKDMAEYFRHGKVAAVQVVTALLRKGHMDPNALSTILMEYAELPDAA
ncbi:dihydroorotate dehydrogenase [Candidatus Parcubacteria bacterium]|nr:MAG: dihydroorotate dehydrogenase [Candidatus Parcubacteria bacterium]